MAEYIEREATLKTLQKLGSRDYRRTQGTIADAVKMIMHPHYTPTADVAEVRHGEWVDGHCTECGKEAMYSTFDEPIYDYDWEENLRYSHTETNVEYQLTDYCPHCGADMRGGKHETL